MPSTHIGLLLLARPGGRAPARRPPPCHERGTGSCRRCVASRHSWLQCARPKPMYHVWPSRSTAHSAQCRCTSSSCSSGGSGPSYTGGGNVTPLGKTIPCPLRTVLELSRGACCSRPMPAAKRAQRHEVTKVNVPSQEQPAVILCIIKRRSSSLQQPSSALATRDLQEEDLVKRFLYLATVHTTRGYPTTLVSRAMRQMVTGTGTECRVHTCTATGISCGPRTRQGCSVHSVQLTVGSDPRGGKDGRTSGAHTGAGDRALSRTASGAALQPSLIFSAALSRRKTALLAPTHYSR